MSIASLQGIWPAFGLVPDVAEEVDWHHHGQPDTAWFEAHIPQVRRLSAQDPVFLARIWRRLEGHLDRPVCVKTDALGRTVHVLLGTWLLVQQRNGCLRAYSWRCEALGRVRLMPVADRLIVAQEMPYRLAWLKELVRPVTLEYLCWRGLADSESQIADVERYIDWVLLELFACRIVQQGRLRPLRRQITAQVRLDPWVLAVANRQLRPHGMPQRALLADYNRVQRNRGTFAKLESDAPNLVSLFGVLCRTPGFPRRGEPVQRLRDFLLAKGISPRAWRIVTRSTPRLWLTVNQFYEGPLHESVLDLIRCIDRLGFDRPPPLWLLDRLLAVHGGPATRFRNYSDALVRKLSVWRHLVHLLQGRSFRDGILAHELEDVIRWVGAMEFAGLKATQRRAGWPWMSRQAQAWDTQEQLRLRSKLGRWRVPMTELEWMGYRFRFLDSPLALWQEARAMLHCADQFGSKCARQECWLVSIRRNGRRVATLQLDRLDEQWRLRQLAGKANQDCVTPIWSAARGMVALLNGQGMTARARRTWTPQLTARGATA